MEGIPGIPRFHGLIVKQPWMQGRFGASQRYFPPWWEGRTPLTLTGISAGPEPARH